MAESTTPELTTTTGEKTQVVTFSAISKDNLTSNDNYTRLVLMETQLTELASAWNKIVSATTTTDGDSAYKELQKSHIKIVNLKDIKPEEKVFLGGSRKRRQSKKRKNHKNHNNNQ